MATEKQNMMAVVESLRQLQEFSEASMHLTVPASQNFDRALSTMNQTTQALGHLSEEIFRQRLFWTMTCSTESFTIHSLKDIVHFISGNLNLTYDKGYLVLMKLLNFLVDGFTEFDAIEKVKRTWTDVYLLVLLRVSDFSDGSMFKVCQLDLSGVQSTWLLKRSLEDNGDKMRSKVEEHPCLVKDLGSRGTNEVNYIGAFEKPRF